VFQKGHPFFFGYCSFGFAELLASLRRFFCSSKRNEPKKRRPEMPTSAFLSARYTKPYWRHQKGCSSHHFRFAYAQFKKVNLFQLTKTGAFINAAKGSFG
jgi:hypothetical protein